MLKNGILIIQNTNKVNVNNDVVPSCYIDVSAGRSQSCTFSTTCSWTTPTSVLQLNISAVGGGGGGAGGCCNLSGAGGGGSGGAVIDFPIYVTNAQTVCIQLGTGGGGGNINCFACSPLSTATYICDANGIMVCVGAGGMALSAASGCGGNSPGDKDSTGGASVGCGVVGLIGVFSYQKYFIGGSSGGGGKNNTAGCSGNYGGCSITHRGGLGYYGQGAGLSGGGGGASIFADGGVAGCSTTAGSVGTKGSGAGGGGYNISVGGEGGCGYAVISWIL